MALTALCEVIRREELAAVAERLITCSPPGALLSDPAWRASTPA
jgi:hypothetical protein